MIQKKKFSDAISANISVVEGLLPKYLKVGFVTSATSANDYIETGLYKVTKTLTEGPKEYVINGGSFIEVHQWDTNNIYQYLTINSNKAPLHFYRKRSFGKWIEWIVQN